ncbi:hypothetical protein [Clostridium sp.]|uniref:hypothetical protein n=1 Tax=Clostridium sp. TaxID=1506 RepID=UPI002845C057|nr:hypothetical protein [Clostridium sp.]MDR3594242.1 hypothetical protein [Clostridium sp.]
MDNEKRFSNIERKYDSEGKDIEFIKSMIKKSIKDKNKDNEEFENSLEHKELVEEINFLKKYEEQKREEIIKSEAETEISISEKKEIIEIISEKLPSIVSKQISEIINELNKKVVDDRKALKESVEKFKSYNDDIKKDLKGKEKTSKTISSVMIAITFLWQLPGKWKENIVAQQIISIDSNVFKIVWAIALIICLFVLILYKTREADYNKKAEEYENEFFQEEIFQEFVYGHNDESFNKKDLISYIKYYLIRRQKDLVIRKSIKRRFFPGITINDKITGVFKYSTSSYLLESLADLIIEKALIKGAIIKKDTKSFLDRYEFGEYRNEIDFTDMSKTRLYDFDNIVAK